MRSITLNIWTEDEEEPTQPETDLSMVKNTSDREAFDITDGGKFVGNPSLDIGAILEELEELRGLSQSLLHELFDYKDGNLYWRVDNPERGIEIDMPYDGQVLGGPEDGDPEDVHVIQ